MHGLFPKCEKWLVADAVLTALWLKQQVEVNRG